MLSSAEFIRDGAYFSPGDRLVQPELTSTIGRISRDGASDFYEGETARRLARASTEGGGLGLLRMLGILEGSGYEKSGAGSANTIHFMTEAMRRFFADRSRWLGDPGFVRVSVAGLLRPDYIARLRRSIDPERATPIDRVQPGKRPLSSMTPTIVLQVLLNVIDFGMNIQDAVGRPRFHHQWKPDKQDMEPAFSPDTLALLRARGHDVETAASIGEAAAILAAGGWLQRAAGPRVEGKATGY